MCIGMPSSSFFHALCGLNNDGKRLDNACCMLFRTLLSSFRVELTQKTKSKMVNSFNYLIYQTFHSDRSFVSLWLTTVYSGMLWSWNVHCFVISDCKVPLHRVIHFAILAISIGLLWNCYRIPFKIRIILKTFIFIEKLWDFPRHGTDNVQLLSPWQTVVHMVALSCPSSASCLLVNGRWECCCSASWHCLFTSNFLCHRLLPMALLAAASWFAGWLLVCQQSYW